MSVPVLSWLFGAGRSDPERPPSQEGPRNGPGTSPGSPCRTGLAQSRHAPGPASLPGPTDPALRANPFPEVTDLICRLPLPTLFYRPEAIHLGDRLRLWVRAEAKISRCPSDFQGPAEAHRTPQEPRCFTGPQPLSPGEPIPGRPTLTKKRQLFPGLPPASPSSFALQHWLREAATSAFGFGNIDPIPFRIRGATHERPTPPLGTELPYSLGSTDPCATAVHMEPFSTLGPQGSHLNICYYHQDLHPRRLHAGSRPTLQRSPQRPSYSSGLTSRAGVTSSAPTAGYRRHAQRHPFSGLVDSAGELLHTP